MVHYVFWLFSGGASQPGGGGGVPKPPSHLAAARRSSKWPQTLRQNQGMFNHLNS